MVHGLHSHDPFLSVAGEHKESRKPVSVTSERRCTRTNEASMSVKGVGVVGNSKSSVAWQTVHCCGQRWKNQHKSLCRFRATRLAANAGRNVSETGEMGDAALARVNTIGSEGAAVRAYDASLGVQRDIGLCWLQQR